MRRITVFYVAVLFLFIGLMQRSDAMPNFARKYNMDCAVCHSVVPKLNRTGYEFRLAGYRLPADIGKDESPVKLNDFFSARLQEQFQYKKHDDINSIKNSSSSQLEFFEATLYPLTGSWGKYFGSLGEFSMAPDDVFEVENAFVRIAYGNEQRFFSARIGIMHPWEGIGASDRPVGNVRPIFQKAAAPGSPFFLWNLDESAIEAAYFWGKSGTTVSARVSNGIIWKEDGSGTAEPAQGGALVKPKTQPGFNDKNFQIFLNQFIHGDSAVSFYYYRGTNPFPDPFEEFLTPTLDTFHRLAVYGNYWAVPDRLDLLAAYEHGKDSLDDTTIVTPDGKFNGAKVGDSDGWMVEADYHVKPEFAFGARYDTFDPTDKVVDNTQKAFSLFANYRFWQGLQLIPDYQYKTTEQPVGGNNKDHQFTARLIFIW